MAEKSRRRRRRRSRSGAEVKKITGPGETSGRFAFVGDNGKASFAMVRQTILPVRILSFQWPGLLFFAPVPVSDHGEQRDLPVAVILPL